MINPRSFLKTLCAGIILTGLAGAISHGLEPQTAPAAEAVPAAMVLFEKHVPLSGSLVARNEVLIYPKVSGYAVTQLLVDVGDWVEPGQHLASLQDDTLQALLQQADAEHNRARAGVKQAESQISSVIAALSESTAALERARQLRVSGNISQAALDQAETAQATAQANAESAQDGLTVAQAGLAVTEAAARIARLNLDHSKITSPVAGLVTSRHASLGDLSGSSAEPMFRITQGGEIELAAEVSESGLPELQHNAEVTLNLSGLGPVQGHIRQLPAVVDPLTRLGVVRVSLPDSDLLRAGMFASGHVVTQSRQALGVPVTAVLSDGMADYVQVVEGGVVQSRPVKAGLVWDGQREIMGGLNAGEKVLTRAGAFFSDGDPVQIVDPAGRTQAAP